MKSKTKKVYTDPVELEVLGRLAVEGIFLGAEPAAPWREAVELADVLAIAAREPELMEALPALVWARPSVFVSTRSLPADLAEAVDKLERGGAPEFRGHAGAAVRAWVKTLDRKLKPASVLKSFRFTEADRELLLGLCDELGLSETDVVRHALRLLAARS
ncbi:MAG TPA: hypothetical protein VMI54_25605 [Polyangiaceae bacterium]|nr:hypothetical protein [Polyangiaceae bacterium]